MNNKYKNIPKSLDNKALIISCVIKILKSPLNWFIVFISYVMWRLVGMYSEMGIVGPLEVTYYNTSYFLWMSFITMLAGLINNNNIQLAKLTVLAEISLAVNIITLSACKIGIGISAPNIPIGYYLSIISIFLFFVQIKQLICFSYSKYQELLASEGITENIKAINKFEQPEVTRTKSKTVNKSNIKKK